MLMNIEELLSEVAILYSTKNCGIDLTPSTLKLICSGFIGDSPLLHILKL